MMSRSILTTGVLLALVLGTGLEGTTATARTAPRGGDDETVSQESYLRLMNRALDDLIRRLERAEHSRVSFGANLFLAHEVAIRRMPVDVLLEMVDAFAEAGVTRVDLNMGLFPWLAGEKPTIEKYDRLVAHIRERGLQLAINPQYSAVHEVDGFTGWRQAALEVYPAIAERYQPDIFIVVHEPTTQAARLGVDVSPAEWEQFARDAARAVRAVAPRARLGAGGLATEAECLDRFMELSELELLTIDIYALRQLRGFNEIVSRAQRRGKTVYVEETWRPGRFEPTPGQEATLDDIVSASIGNQAYQEIDAKWLRAMALYAASLGLESVTPFWTQTFFAYVPEDWSGLDPRYNQRVVEAVRRGERTPTYRALEALIRELGPPPRGGASARPAPGIR